MLLALDKSSVRTFDDDGHLHISTANLSKAAVNPYLGKEIPGYKDLGLDADKIYKLLRHPDEMRKGAPSFAGKPVLAKHIPVSADDHPHDKTVGAIGTNVSFNHPFMRAPLTLWDGDAIKSVTSGRKQQLSMGYRYEPDMTPGSFEGEHYDGVMRNIIGNHCALVEEGRAGPDCIIGDSTEVLAMVKPLSRKAALVQGAVIGFLAPQLAQDAKIDLTPAFVGVDEKNYGEKRAVISAGILKAVEGKLAQDADLADLARLLDAFSGPAAGGEGEGDAPVLDPSAAAPVDGEEDPAKDADPADLTDPAAAEPDGGADPDAGAGEGEADKGDDAGDAIAQARSFLASKLSPEDLNHFNSLVAKIGAEEGSEAETDSPEGEDAMDPNTVGSADPAPDQLSQPTGDEDEDENDKENGKMSKPAMDAAVAAKVAPAVAAAVAAYEAKIDARNSAKAAVESAIGKVVACDSATDYYRLGLKSFGVKGAEAMPAAALKPTFDALAEARKEARAPKKADPLAQDSAEEAAYAAKFPNANRLKR